MSTLPPNPANPYQQPQWPAGARAPARSSGMPLWAKLLIAGGVAGGLLVVLVCAGLFWLGSRAPDTRAVPGSQLSARHMETIRSLGLVDPGERVKYFYSDGGLSIENGMYFFTDDKFIVYGRDFTPATTVVTWGEVVNIDAEFSDSWWIDGSIWLELADDSVVTIPICNEGGADRIFFDTLVRTWQGDRRAAAGAD